MGAAAFDDDRHRDDGTPLAGVAFIVDLREQVRLRETRDRLLRREQRARTETELANARLLQLVEGSKRLSRAMNPYDTLETLAAVVVPGLADWSYVVHRGWDGGSALVAFAAGDPHKRALLESLNRCTPDPDAAEGAPRVFRTGEPALYEDIAHGAADAGRAGRAHRGDPQPRVPADPARAGDEVAALRAHRGAQRRRGGDHAGRQRRPAPLRHEDIVLARDLAARAAVSLENGRLLSEALEAVRARDDFLAVAAHELRTPLTSLLLANPDPVARDRARCVRRRRRPPARSVAAAAESGAAAVDARRRAAGRGRLASNRLLVAGRGDGAATSWSTAS